MNDVQVSQNGFDGVCYDEYLRTVTVFHNCGLGGEIDRYQNLKLLRASGSNQT
jgi:hypothetical protein